MIKPFHWKTSSGEQRVPHMGLTWVAFLALLLRVDPIGS